MQQQLLRDNTVLATAVPTAAVRQIDSGAKVTATPTAGGGVAIAAALRALLFATFLLLLLVLPPLPLLQLLPSLMPPSVCCFLRP